jgi:hypothetical protein
MNLCGKLCLAIDQGSTVFALREGYWSIAVTPKAISGKSLVYLQCRYGADIANYSVAVNQGVNLPGINNQDLFTLEPYASEDGKIRYAFPTSAPFKFLRGETIARDNPALLERITNNPKYIIQADDLLRKIPVRK